MNDHRLDAKIVAASDRRSDDTNTFVKDTMQKIRALQAKESPDSHQKTSKWNSFLQLTRRHRLAFGVVAALAVSTVAFTGYAYAIGSDPVSLIKRWVEGDKVKIEYDGRQFEHGTSRAYSDAAITALAEANTVEGLAFRAKNALQTPKDGIEYVGLPQNMSPSEVYQYPYLATITAINTQTITLQKQYLWGDKMNPSHDLNETVSIPTGIFRHFVKGEPATATASDAGKLVMIYPETSIRHTISTNQAVRDTVHFSFALTHSLESFKEVGKKGPVEPSKDAILFEPSWGGLSDICLNNGADTCDYRRFSQPENQGLYPISKKFGQGMAGYNQDAIAQGEGVGPNDAQPANLISRNIMGKITAMNDTYITVKTSSGTEWRLAYDKAQRDAFAKEYKNELKVGDKIVGQVLESIYNLNNRTIENKYIKSLERYQ